MRKKNSLIVKGFVIIIAVWITFIIGACGRQTVADEKERVEESAVEESVMSEEVLPDGCGEYLVVYYPSWAKYGGLKAKDIDAEKITHIHYAFAETNAQYVPFATNINEHKDNLEQLAALREQNPDLKLVLSIGGGGGDKYFSAIGMKEENLITFTEGCMDFLATYDFDGIDLDWEFPRTEDDKNGFTKMVLYLRDAMNELEKDTGRHYTLSVAGAADSGQLTGIPYDDVLPYLDYVFIMGYNLYGTWSDKTNFNAPMYAPGEDKYTGYSLYSIVNTYVGEGVPANKLVLGLPMYGYVLPVKSADNHGLYQPFESVSYDTAYESYRNVFANYLGNDSYREFWDEDTQSPYLFGENTFIGYENEASVKAKASLVKEFKLAGVGFWEISQDTDDFRLLNAAYEAMEELRKNEY